MEKSQPRFWSRWTFRLTVLAAVLLGLRAYQHRGIASGPATPFVGTALSGRVISFEDFAGQPVVVHFWATWCGVCEAMDGNVRSLARDHRVLSVATQSGSASQIREYLRGRRTVAPVLVDPSGGLAEQYGVSALPSTFFIDRKGRIRFAEVGYTTEIGLRLRLWLADRLP